MSLGEQIKLYRVKAGLSQDELGERLFVNGEKVSGKTISSWEVDRTEPKIGLIEQMCNIFKCQKTDLLGPDRHIDMDLSIIQRERSKMSDKEKTKLMNILKANFDDYNWEEDDSGDID